MADEERPVSGPERKPRTGGQVAERISKVLTAMPPVPAFVGVQPLNIGFFKLEAIRNRTVAKAKDEKKAKVKG